MMKGSLEESVLHQIDKLEEELDYNQAKRVEITRMRTMALKLGAFSKQCATCKELLKELDTYLRENAVYLHAIVGVDKKRHTQLLNKVAGHCQKAHGIHKKGFYVNLGMVGGLLIAVVVLSIVLGSVPISTACGIGLLVGGVVGSVVEQEMRRNNKIV